MANRWSTLVTRLAALPTQVYAEWKDLAAALTNLCQIQSGTYTGTGVAISVATEGNPRVVVLVDTTQSGMAVHISGMAAASLLSIDNGGTSYVAANGITLGTDGFTIGTSALVNTNLDAGIWFALI